MTIVETTRPITGGVDTHLDVHVAAAVDANGGVLGVESFATTPAGYGELCSVGWRRSARSMRVGVEGTGAYGAGLARHLRGQGVVVIEVDRPNRQERRRNGKSDELDAIEAARAALSGRASGIAKSADGDVEAIRALLVARRSGRNVRIKYLNQIRHLGFTAPDELRERLRDVPTRPVGAHRGGVASHRRERHRHVRDEARDRGRWDVVSSRSRPTATSRRLYSTRWCGAPRRACSRSTASASTPPRSCSSPPATTRTGSTAKPRSRTCVASHPCPRHRGRPSNAFGSTPAATVKPTMPSGGSCSPA